MQIKDKSFLTTYYNMLNDQEEEQVVETPMGDDDIKRYFPSAKIEVYSDLSKYDNIDGLLPSDKSFMFMLIEDSPNKGHWVCLSRYNDMIEFFDSYGGQPDSQLKWNNTNTNEKLGQGKKLLSGLLNNFDGKVVYNPVKYQSDGSDINTCGRHCTFRIQNMQSGKNLDDYFKYMKQLKNSMDRTYDEVVSQFIRE